MTCHVPATRVSAVSRRSTRCRRRWLAPSPRRQVRLLRRLADLGRWIARHQVPIDPSCQVPAGGASC